MAAHGCKRSTASVASLCKQPASQSSLQIMQGLPGSCSAGLLQATRRGVAAALQQQGRALAPCCAGAQLAQAGSWLQLHGSAWVKRRCFPSDVYWLSYDCNAAHICLAVLHAMNSKGRRCLGCVGAKWLWSAVQEARCSGQAL